MGLFGGANSSAKSWIKSNKKQLKIYRDWWSLYQAMGDYWLGEGCKPSWADKVDVDVMDKFLYNLK